MRGICKKLSDWCLFFCIFKFYLTLSILVSIGVKSLSEKSFSSSSITSF